MSSEESFNKEIDYEITNNYELPNEAEIYYEESFNELLNDEEIFDDEVLVDEVLNDKGLDKIVDEALNIEKMLSISGEYIPYFKSTTEAKQLKNYFVIGFVPFDGCFNNFIVPFINKMKKLEKGIIIDMQGNKSLVIANLGDMTADLPQGNDLAGIKRHVSCYHHLTNSQFEEISLASILKRCKELATEYGLYLQPPILDRLKREKHL
ncbi:21306_t:CDS:2, partial [Racocetra persica]